jgi:hypothetical protein
VTTHAINNCELAQTIATVDRLRERAIALESTSPGTLERQEGLTLAAYLGNLDKWEAHCLSRYGGRQ